MINISLLKSRNPKSLRKTFEGQNLLKIHRGKKIEIFIWTKNLFNPKFYKGGEEQDKD
jgi:hypothetical protein